MHIFTTAFGNLIIYLCDKLTGMRKYLYISLALSSLLYGRALAQSSHFALVPGSVSNQVKGKAYDSLSLFYKVAYISTDSTPFNGWIYTKFITNNDSIPGTANDSFNTAAQVPPLTINNGDTVGIYCHILVKHPYFIDGKGNLIVIWPTSSKQSNKATVPCTDSFKYVAAVAISGFSGIAENDDPFASISIYPNPANTFLNIQNTNPALMIKLARIIDYNGREIISRQDQFAKIDVSALKPGTYFLELNSKDGDKTVYTFIISR